MARREDAPPHVEMFEGSKNLDEEDDDESEEEDEEDDEPPPPMNDSSGSDADGIEPPPSKVYNMRNAEGKWTKTTIVSGNPEGSKTSKQAPAPKVQKPAASSAAAGKGEEDSIWNQFHKYRAGLMPMDRLGIVALKQWESFKRNGSIHPKFLSWYEDLVKGNRSVPQAMAVEGLPSGFPEFCHWIEEGDYKPSAGSLKAGFQLMAVQHVKEVKSALGAGAGGPQQSPADKSTAVESLKLRRRERRLGKKGFGANEELVARMQKTLAEVGTITGKEPGEEDGGFKASLGRAFRAGLDAEEEMRKKMMSAGAVESDGDDGEVSQGNRYKDLTPNVRNVLEGLTRAKAYRRRAQRNFELLEAELVRCYSRMARMEAQYQTLVAETRGAESFRDALASAELLIAQAGKFVNADAAVRALGELSIAVKLLEVHVSDYLPESKESEELVRGRQVFGLALCNRSLANLRLGNAYNAKDDAKRAVEVWPHEISKGHLDRCLAHLRREGAQIKPPNWKAYVGPS